LNQQTVPWKNRKPPALVESGDEEFLRAAHPTAVTLRKGPLPLRELFIFPIIISISNYVTLAFLNTTLAALLPLFLAMPIEIGGLGLPPYKIGLILSTYGIATGLFQVLFFARFVRRFGERRVFINGLMTCLPVFTLFPIMSMIARRSGLSIIVWMLVGCVLGLGALMDTSFGEFSYPAPFEGLIAKFQALCSCSSPPPLLNQAAAL
jgi:MFS family permease